VHMS